MGAGPYPTSEPEVRALVDFITRHGNIIGGTAFHTWAGVLLRLSTTRATMRCRPKTYGSIKRSARREPS